MFLNIPEHVITILKQTFQIMILSSMQSVVFCFKDKHFFPLIYMYKQDKLPWVGYFLYPSVTALYSTDLVNYLCKISFSSIESLKLKIVCLFVFVCLCGISASHDRYQWLRHVKTLYVCLFVWLVLENVSPL